MYDPVNFLSAFDLLIDELESGRRLSDKLLPSIEPGVLFANMRSASCAPSHPLRTAVATGGGTDMASAVADTLPAETLRGVLDGVAIVCLCMAWVLFEHDAEAVTARECAARTPEDEFALVVAATDTNPIGDDPDSVQVALLNFLQNQPLETCVADLAIAAYGRAEAYGNGDRRVLIRTCHAFLSEVYTLLKHNENLNVQERYAPATAIDAQPAPSVETPVAAPAAAVVEEAAAVKKHSSKKPPLPRTNSGSSSNGSPVGSRPVSPALDSSTFSFTVPQKVDRSTSPIRDMFYSMAESPFSQGLSVVSTASQASQSASLTTRSVSPPESSPEASAATSGGHTPFSSRPVSPAVPGMEVKMFDLIAALEALSDSDSEPAIKPAPTVPGAAVGAGGDDDDDDEFLRSALFSRGAAS